MAMCPNCRLEVGSSKFCPNCGAQIRQDPAVGTDQSYTDPVGTKYYGESQQQTYYYEQPAQQTYQQPVTDTGSIGWAVLGFFFPLIGLILFLVWKDTKPVSARQAGKGALVGVIVSFLATMLTTCAGIGLYGLSDMYDY